MILKDECEDEDLSLNIGEEDSELIQKLKEIIYKTD